MAGSDAENDTPRLQPHRSPRPTDRRNTRRLGRNIRVGTRDVYLTPTEFRLLEVFRQRRRHGFTRAELAALVMPDAVVLDRTIDVHVKSLRRKLAGGRERIETVYGVGYRLVTDESS